MEGRGAKRVKMSESTAASPPVSEWKDLPWKMIQRTVWKLQKRIFRAVQRGDQRAVHRLEHLLMKSWSAKCLAVRRGKQDKPGKKKAGGRGGEKPPPPPPPPPRGRPFPPAQPP